MGTVPKLAIVAVAHITYVVVAYATSFFGLHLPHRLIIILWLAGSSSLALIAYVWVLFRSQVMATEPGRPMKLAFMAITFTLVSLYLGIFISYDTFGT